MRLVREMQDGDTVAVAVRVTGHTEGGGRRPLTVRVVDCLVYKLTAHTWKFHIPLIHFTNQPTQHQPQHQHNRSTPWTRRGRSWT